MIKGIHHVCLKCNQSEVEKVKAFYHGLLELSIVRQWGEPELKGFMLDTGSGIVEVFTDAQEALPQGSIRHFSLETESVDECIRQVREAGYQVTVEPKDVVIPSEIPFALRVAFCVGPLGEEIEFLQEK